MENLNKNIWREKKYFFEIKNDKIVNYKNDLHRLPTVISAQK